MRAHFPARRDSLKRTSKIQGATEPSYLVTQHDMLMVKRKVLVLVFSAPFRHDVQTLRHSVCRPWSWFCATRYTTNTGANNTGTVLWVGRLERVRAQATMLASHWRALHPHSFACTPSQTLSWPARIFHLFCKWVPFFWVSRREHGEQCFFVINCLAIRIMHPAALLKSEKCRAHLV